MARTHDQSTAPVDGVLYEETRAAELRTIIAARCIGLGVLALFALFIPADASLALRLAAVGVFVAGAPFVIVVERHMSASNRDLFHLVCGLTQVGVATALIPEMWSVAFVTWIAFSITLVAQRLDLGSVLVVFYGLAGLIALGTTVGDELNGAALVAGMAWLALLAGYYRAWRAGRAETDERYSRLVSSAKLFFWEIEIETGLIVAINGDTEGALGWTRDEVLGTSYERYVVNLDQIGFDRVLAGQEVFDNVLPMRHRDGHVVPIRNHMRNLGNGRLQAAASDVTELTAAADRIAHQSEHDELTDLYNRPGLLRRLEEELARPDRADNLCLIAIDLVRFMEVNDAFGHEHGDEVLRIIGARLAAEAQTDVVARLGGNEFALLASCDATAQARGGMPPAVASIVETIRRPVTISGAGIAVRASVGVASAADGVTPIELLRQVDIATHYAKVNRLPWSRYEPAPIEPIVERLRLAAQLDEAIDAGQFALWVQPKVSMRRGELVGVEGLARWHHPEFGLVTPDRFIGIIELSNAYQRFTDAMLEQAVAFVHAALPHWPDAQIAVNLHPRSFDDPDLVSHICDVLHLGGLDPHRLVVEITEVDAITENGTAIERCHELVAAGIGLSVDDFGTGHSSLSRIRLVEPTEVKLDRAFIRNLDQRPQDRTIVQSTVEMAERLGIDCVAEGVETADISQILRNLGCDVVQGFHFGRPMPVDDFLAQLSGDVPPTWAEPLRTV